MRLALAAAFCALAVFAHAPAHAQGLPAIEEAAPLRPLTTLAERLPWQAIGRLDTGTGFCTATLIDSDIVLTAAHCLFDRDTGQRFTDAALTFRAGLTDGQAAATRAIAASAVAPDYVFNRDAGPERVASDIALLRLATPIRVAEIRPIPVGAAPRAGDAVALVSYGRDREEVASLEEDCAVRGMAADRVVVLDCRVDPGTSGAPVIALRQGQILVVSIVSASASMDGAEVGLAAEVASQIADLRPDLLIAQSPATSGLPQVRTIGGGSDGRDTVGARFVRP